VGVGGACGGGLGRGRAWAAWRLVEADGVRPVLSGLTWLIWPEMVVVREGTVPRPPRRLIRKPLVRQANLLFLMGCKSPSGKG